MAKRAAAGHKHHLAQARHHLAQAHQHLAQAGGGRAGTRKAETRKPARKGAEKK